MKRYIQATVASFQDDDLSVRREVARTTSRPNLLQQCFDDEHYLVRLALLNNPNTPDYMLDELCSNFYFASQASGSSRTSPEALRKILSCADATGRWEFVYEHLAGNPNSPEDVLRAIWDKGYFKGIILRNPSVPLDILGQGATSVAWHYRQAVAENPNTPTDILIMLAHDPEEDVRTAVAGNKNTPESVLQELAPDSYIARCRLRGVDFE